MLSCFDISSLSQPCRSSSTTCRSLGLRIFSSTTHLFYLQTVTPTPNKLALKSTTFGVDAVILCTCFAMTAEFCRKNEHSQSIQLDNVHICSSTSRPEKADCLTRLSELFHIVSTTKLKSINPDWPTSSASRNNQGNSEWAILDPVSHHKAQGCGILATLGKTP